MCPFATETRIRHSTLSMTGERALHSALRIMAVQQLLCLALTHLQERQRIQCNHRVESPPKHLPSRGPSSDALLTRLVRSTPPSFRWMEAPNRAIRALNKSGQNETESKRINHTHKLASCGFRGVYSAHVTLPSTVIVSRGAYCCGRSNMSRTQSTASWLFALTLTSFEQLSIRDTTADYHLVY
jgi:hypothetical protein